MKNWFKKDIKIKILSLLSAIFFWLYVTNLKNPFVPMTFYNIPVTFENEDYLEQNGYTIKNTIRSYIDVTIRGRQEAVDKVRSTDFETTLDFSRIKSVNDKKLYLTEPTCLKKDVTIESYSPVAIDIQLGRKKTASFKVELKTNIAMKPGYILLGAAISPDVFQLTEEENLINSVDKIVADLELKDLDRDTKTQVQCKVYNKTGKEIESLSSGLNATASVEVAKEVAVSLVTRGRLATDYVETLRVIDPVKILVTGPVEVLENLSDLKTKQLDIDKINSNFTAAVPLVVPEGVTLVNGQNEITVNISVEKLVVKDIELGKEDISILNAKNDGTLTYEIISEGLMLQFKGRQSEVDSIRPEVLKAAVDVSGLSEGTHKLQLYLTVPAQVKLLQQASAEVRIDKTPENPLPPEGDRTGGDRT